MKKQFYHKRWILLLALVSVFWQQSPHAQSLLITGGTDVVASDNPWITIHNGSWLNNGNFVPDYSRVALRRTEGSWIRLGGSSESRFYHLITNSGGPDGVMVLEQDIYIIARWDPAGHMTDIGNHRVTLGPGAVLGQDGVDNYITGNDGKIITTVDLNAPQGVNPGNLGIEITTSSNLGKTTIIRGFKEQFNAAGKKSILRYYDIQPTSQPGSDTKLRFSFSDKELNGNSKNELAVFTGKAGSRLRMIASGNASANNWISTGKVDQLQRFTLGNAIHSSTPAEAKPMETKVYPNPFRDRFTVQVYSEAAKQVELRIYDLSGGLIERRSVKLNAGANIVEWSTAKYVSGVYHLVIGGDLLKAIKVVKQ
ncbi:T9SS type A sorting domain-containing protein [Pseudoflavitalea sp. G-6-1-2]|uniref:T9SS type A sorting domain-containing protein n=1 Tax=Pseudoflavitalea sp. G-6-1-2 TaxID=2728841 RepID=UPI00146D5362|nr:T9SS type A sorting domain-containing protein [Pseudoflavitalea sp. G-6-1-2]NML21495.1 T9SS type A sorting domain-containing protein [Pseudoflavitalea sp. G-6-1-2]